MDTIEPRLRRPHVPTALPEGSRTVSSIKTRDAHAGVTLTVPAHCSHRVPSNSVLQVPPRQRRSRRSTRPARRSTPHLKSVIRSSRAIRASSSTMAPCALQAKYGDQLKPISNVVGRGKTHVSCTHNQASHREPHEKHAEGPRTKMGGKDTQLLRRTPPLAQIRLSDKDRRAWNRNFATDSQRIGATKLATTQHAEKASAMNRGRRRPKE